MQTVGQREAYLPALQRGEFQVFPEYVGTLAEYLDGNPDEAVVSGDLDASVETLRGLGETNGLTFGEPAEAADENAFAITTALQEELGGITTLSELADACSDGSLVLGGTPECPTRPFCQPGLEEVYGFSFASVQDSTWGRRPTRRVQQGVVSLALALSTDPIFAAGVAVQDSVPAAGGQLLPGGDRRRRSGCPPGPAGTTSAGRRRRTGGRRGSGRPPAARPVAAEVGALDGVEQVAAAAVGARARRCRRAAGGRPRRRRLPTHQTSSRPDAGAGSRRRSARAARRRRRPWGPPAAAGSAGSSAASNAGPGRRGRTAGRGTPRARPRRAASRGGVANSSSRPSRQVRQPASGSAAERAAA